MPKKLIRKVTLADAKSTPSYFLGPTFMGLLMLLSDLSSKLRDLPHWGRKICLKNQLNGHRPQVCPKQLNIASGFTPYRWTTNGRAASSVGVMFLVSVSLQGAILEEGGYKKKALFAKFIKYVNLKIYYQIKRGWFQHPPLH